MAFDKLNEINELINCCDDMKQFICDNNKKIEMPRKGYREFL